MNLIFITKIEKGKIKMGLTEEDRMSKYIGSLKDGLYDITVKKHVHKRTLDQNAYYFGVVLVILSDFFGYEVDEMHEEMKLKFNPVKPASVKLRTDEDCAPKPLFETLTI